MDLMPLGRIDDPAYPARNVCLRLRRVAAVTSTVAALCLTGCGSDGRHSEPVPLAGTPPSPELVTEVDAGVGDDHVVTIDGTEEIPLENVEVRPGGVPPHIVLPDEQDGGATNGGD